MAFSGSLLLLLLLLLLSPALTSGCAYSASRRALPPGHPPLLGVTAPGVPYMDAAGEATVFPHLPYSDWLVPRAIANLSAAYNVSLCYWSQQVLPSPPTGFDPSTGACGGAPCAWPLLPARASDVQALYALGEQATARMALMDAQRRAFLGSSCGGGYGNARTACAAQPGSAKCSPAVLAQASRWAVASNILRITPDTLQDAIANVTDWRAGGAWHAPAIGSALVASGWGFGGAISFKTLPCAAIPAPLLATAYGCDELDAASGRPVWDEAFEFWSSYKAPPWLAAEVAGLQARLLSLQQRG